jgi:uncharacterized membrane protein YeaQ/YmgE (transglycosylase-associated protein family)
MARVKDPNKEPGRLKQIWQVLQMTRRVDPSVTWWLVLSVVGPVLLGIAGAFILAPWSVNPVGFVLYIIIGLFAGILIGIIVLGRKAERAAYSQIEGQAGAVGAVLKNGLRRSWVASEMPVHVSPKSQDAVYRAVGRGGIVLIGEGPRSRTQRILEDERRKVARIVPNVPISFVYVGPDPDSTPLYRLSTELRRLKPALRKQEVMTVNSRLQSLGKNLLPIPKGVDPFKMRASRAR